MERSIISVSQLMIATKVSQICDLNLAISASIGGTSNFIFAKLNLGASIVCCHGSPKTHNHLSGDEALETKRQSKFVSRTLLGFNAYVHETIPLLVEPTRSANSSLGGVTNHLSDLGRKLGRRMTVK